MLNFYRYFLISIMTRTKSVTSVMSAHFLLDMLTATGHCNSDLFSSGTRTQSRQGLIEDE